MNKTLKLLVLILISTLSLNAAVQKVTDGYVTIQTAGDTYVGTSANQTYSINPSKVESGDTITIIDQEGTNAIELVGGLTISSSIATSDELQLTLSNGAVVNIRGASAFTYNVGANQSSGTAGQQQNFESFVTSTLGLASVPTTGVGTGGGVDIVAGGEEISSISGLIVNPSRDISVFAGETKTIGFIPQFIAEDKNTTSYLENNPNWITIGENNTILIAPVASQVKSIVSFNIVSQAQGETSSKKQSIVVEVFGKVLLLSGQLGPDGGTIENGWKDIAIQVDANKLSKIYTINYYAGLNERQELSFKLDIIPTISELEMGELNFIQASDNIIIDNYLSSELSNINRNLRVSNVYDVFSDNTVDSTCRPKRISDTEVNEMVWNDANGDDFSLDYVWRGKEADFNEAFIASGVWSGITGGYPRLQPYKRTLSAKKRCASALRSTIPKTSNQLQGRIPVLFVHGFIGSNDLGGYDSEGEYFDNFPRIVDDLELNGFEYVPFVFQWRTNAKFEDVAGELAQSVKMISEKTGKKVHIVAHSFGGVLSRTMIQGLATHYPSGMNLEDYIQTITTVGSPHSGTYGSATANVSFDGGVEIDFPEGRNAFSGTMIENCVAITCFQTGSGQSILDANPAVFGTSLQFNAFPSLYGTKNRAGYTSYKLAEGLISPNSYPNIDTQVLIGVEAENIHCTDIEWNGDIGTCNLTYDLLHGSSGIGVNPHMGDGLISLQGQRMFPSYLTSSLVTNPSKFEEHFLPFNISTNEFIRGMNDDIIDLYDTNWIDEWTLTNYGTMNIRDIGYLTYEAIESKFIHGYNHMHGHFDTGNQKIHNGLQLGDYNADTYTEVRLKNCIDSNNCDHGTWNYFKTFVEIHPSEQSPTPFDISVGGEVSLVDNGVFTPLIGGEINIFANMSDANPAIDEIALFSNYELIGSTTTDDDGEFSIDIEFIPNTSYRVEVVGSQYRSVASQPIRTGNTVEESNLNFPLITLVENTSVEDAMGNIGVFVKDGSTGQALAGFDYGISNAMRTIAAGSTENASITIIQPAGDYTVAVSREGYSEASRVCTILANASTSCEISMIPTTHLAEGALTAVLEWQVDPRDLDSHLVKYDSNGNQVYHIYFGHKNDSDGSLDVDDISSYGPETVTISNIDTSARYVYAIYHYSGSGSITTTSAASVRLQTSDMFTTYYAPSSGEGSWWKVFEVDNGRIIPCTSDCMFNDQISALRSINPQWLNDISSESKVAK